MGQVVPAKKKEPVTAVAALSPIQLEFQHRSRAAIITAKQQQSRTPAAAAPSLRSLLYDYCMTHTELPSPLIATIHGYTHVSRYYIVPSVDAYNQLDVYRYDDIARDDAFMPNDMLHRPPDPEYDPPVVSPSLSSYPRVQRSPPLPAIDVASTFRDTEVRLIRRTTRSSSDRHDDQSIIDDDDDMIIHVMIRPLLGSSDVQHAWAHYQYSIARNEWLIDAYDTASSIAAVTRV